MMIYSVL